MKLTHERRYGRQALLAVLLLTGVGYVATVASVAAPVILGMLLAAVTAPLRQWLAVRFGGRAVPAAIVTTLLVLLALVPVALVVTEVGFRVGELAEDPALAAQLLGKEGLWHQVLTDYPGLRRFVPMKLNDQVAAALAWVGKAIPGMLAGALDLGLAFFVTCLTLYYLSRDGRHLYERLEPVLPLEPRHTRALVQELEQVGRGVVMGTFGTASLQGVAAGLAYWMVGLPEPLLFGTMTAALSLVPAVGSSLVWVPLAVYLMASGETGKGVFLLGFGAVVVGGLDNVLRPLLTRGASNLHPLQVFLGIFGGLATFGPAGLYLGPLCVALFAAVARIYAREIAPVTLQQPSVAETAPRRLWAKVTGGAS